MWPAGRARRNEMELSVALGLGGWIAVIVGAIVIGLVAQFVGETETGFEWLAVAIGAVVGAIVASEFIVGLREYGPVWDGLAMVPALVGGVVVGLVVDVATRLATGGRYMSGSSAG
jgi:uncharacterized membrane protein YeaQ/YmgE (transglycosylase-associated protein family)